MKEDAKEVVEIWEFVLEGIYNKSEFDAHNILEKLEDMKCLNKKGRELRKIIWNAYHWE